MPVARVSTAFLSSSKLSQVSTNCQQILTRISFVIFDIVLNKKNGMWFSMACTLIDNDTRHHSGQHFDHCDSTYRCR